MREKELKDIETKLRTAAEKLLLGDPFTGADAVECGLANAVLPAGTATAMTGPAGSASANAVPPAATAVTAPSAPVALPTPAAPSAPVAPAAPPAPAAPETFAQYMVRVGSAFANRPVDAHNAMAAALAPHGLTGVGQLAGAPHLIPAVDAEFKRLLG